MSKVANPHAGVGAGRNRRPWRIKEWMDSQMLTQADVADKAGIRAQSVVGRTIRGTVNNRKVLRVLFDLGCPEQYLSLPDDMKETHAQ